MLPNSLVIDHSPHFENTVKVVPPNNLLTRGQIVVSLGSEAFILRRPLLDDHGNADTTTSSTKEMLLPIDSTTTKALGTDNQIVRLKDGALLALRAGAIWDNISPSTPAWFSETVTCFSEHKGQRGCEFLFYSKDGGDNWQL